MKKVSFRVRNFDKEQFLTYDIDNEAELDEDVLDFLEEEEPKGIVPLIFEEGEEFDTFSYNITDKIRLCELANQEINAEMVLMVMRGLVMSLLDMAEYRIPLSYLVLNRNYIYINSDYEVDFICIPLEEMQEEVDVCSFLRNFVAGLRFDLSENGDYVARILSYINNAAIFNLRNFVTLIEDLMDDRGIEIPEESSADIYVDYQEMNDEDRSMNDETEILSQESETGIEDDSETDEAHLETEEVIAAEPDMDMHATAEEAVVSEEEVVEQEATAEETLRFEEEMVEQEATAEETLKFEEEMVEQEATVEETLKFEEEMVKPEVTAEETVEPDAVEEEDEPLLVDEETARIVSNLKKESENLFKLKPVEITPENPETAEKEIAKTIEEDVPEEDAEQEAVTEEAESIIMNLRKKVVSVMDNVTTDNSAKDKKTSFKTKEATVTGVVIQDDLDDYLAEKEKEELEAAQHHDTGLKIKKGIKVNRASIVKESQEEVKLHEETNVQEEPKKPEKGKKLDKIKKTKEAKVQEPVVKEQQAVEETTVEEEVTADTTNDVPAPPTHKVNPYLIRVNTEERIMITKQTFRIGKAGMGVDYTVKGNGAVSRVHAIITNKGDAYYIKDNKSTNRTFLNGTPLGDGESASLTDGCKIVLGDEEFIFKI